ncbi:MAG: ROK family protein [Chloroflexi bacterium]|nr:MAG: ROK family protein [Chloroflexota bacterium]
MSFLVLALDIGGTNFRLALADERGRILKRRSGPTRPEEGPERLLKRVKRGVEGLLSDPDMKRMVKGVGVGAAGPLDLESGMLLHPPNLPGWHHVPLKSMLEESLDFPVWLRNDVDLGALGEHRFGAGRGFQQLIYLALGTGIGGGVILGGQLLSGVRVSAMEAGHMVVSPGGPRCNCGREGCLEALASGTAIARRAAERLSQGEQSQLIEMVGGEAERITAELVARAANKGDRLAQQVLQEAGEWLGIGVVNLILLFDPEVVIIGGGVAGAGDFLLEPVRQAVKRWVVPYFEREVPVVRSRLGGNSNLMGAVALALDEIQATTS